MWAVVQRVMGNLQSKSINRIISHDPIMTYDLIKTKTKNISQNLNETFLNSGLWTLKRSENEYLEILGVVMSFFLLNTLIQIVFLKIRYVVIFAKIIFIF